MLRHRSAVEGAKSLNILARIFAPRNRQMVSSSVDFLISLSNMVRIRAFSRDWIT
jgi:hypothetical protein